MVLILQNIVYLLLIATIVVALSNIIVYFKDENQQSTTLQYGNLLVLTHVIFIALCVVLLHDSVDITLYNPYLLFYGPLSYVTIWDLIWPYKNKLKIALINFTPTFGFCITFLALQYLFINSPSVQQNHNELFLAIVGVQLLIYCVLDFFLLRKKESIILMKNKIQLAFYTIALQSFAGIALISSLFFKWHTTMDKLLLTSLILSFLLLSTLFIFRALMIDKKAKSRKKVS